MTETTDEGPPSDVAWVRLDGGRLLLYDPGNEEAWIESDVSIVAP